MSKFCYIKYKIQNDTKGKYTLKFRYLKKTNL